MYLSARGIPAVIERLNQSKARYAVTGSWAAAEVAPVAPPRLLLVYVDRPRDVEQALHLRPADVGANVALRVGIPVPRYSDSRSSVFSSAMRIPPDAVIDEAKFTNYLLVPRPWDDKSGHLLQAGFELNNWPDLLTAVRRLADAVDAVEDRTNDYGTFYRVEGVLEGPTGNLSVVCIWMKQAVDGKFRFVTLKPARERSGNVSATV